MEIRPNVNFAPNILESMHRAAKITAVREPLEKGTPSPEYSMVNAWPGSTFLRVATPSKTCNNCPEPTTLSRNTSSGFYERTEAPWRSASSPDKHGYDLGVCSDEADRAHYLNGVIRQSNLYLHAMYDDYHAFRQQLSFINPDLGRKYFGFTLGPDLQIKVTDPDGVLTPVEVSYLTEKLNDREKLKDSLHKHAHTVMKLVDHLTEKFGDRYQIDLQDYQSIIDYGQIFTRNSIGNFMDTWAYQVERHAKKREDTQECQTHRVDTEV